MAVFPTLRTGAVAQYPLDRTDRFQTQAVQFLDGSRQRYPIYGAGLRRWGIRLDLLDDRELAAVIAFAEQQRGATFSFLDPVSGVSAPKCIIAGEQFSANAGGEMRNQASLVIEEIA
jgi:hypothetical protein